MKKTGKRIKHKLALKPLGVKNTRYELDARAALLAMKHGVQNQQHLVDLYVLAEITEKLSDEKHIKVHAASVKNIIEQAHQTGVVMRLDYLAIEPSADVLLDCFRNARNADIARVCLESARIQA